MKTKMMLLSAAAAMLILNGCGGGSSSTEDDGTPSVSGILTDSPVEGATYMCGNVTHRTDKNGAFFCDTLPVSFYVGRVKIGEVAQLPDDSYVTPQDLAGVPRGMYDENVAKIAVFLQSLDNDGEIESTIALDQEIVKRLEAEEAELQTMSQSAMIEMLDQYGAADIVAQEDALSHLKRHMAQIEAPEPSSPQEHTTQTQERQQERAEESRPQQVTSSPSAQQELPDTLQKEQPVRTEEKKTKPTPSEETNPTQHKEPDIDSSKRTPLSKTTVPSEDVTPADTTEDTPQTEEEKEDVETPEVEDTPEQEVDTPDEDDKAESEQPEESTIPPLNDALKQAYLDVINEARAEGRECGEYGYFEATDPVTWNNELYAAAYEHSRDMALSNTFSHTGSGTKSDITAEALHPGSGSSVSERIEYNGYTNWRRYGENIAAGTSMDEAVEAMEGWLESPGHCKNIMKPEFKEVGMALYYNEESHYRHYWSQDFGTKK